MNYLWIIFSTYAEALSLNDRVNAQCRSSHKWVDGVTDNYAFVVINQDSSKFAIPIDTLNYKNYFTQQEINSAITCLDSTFSQ